LSAAESATMVAVAGGIAISPGRAAAGASIAYNYLGGSFDPANPNVIDKNTTATDQITASINNSRVQPGGHPTPHRPRPRPPAPPPAGPPTTPHPTPPPPPPPARATPPADTIDVGSNSGFTTGQPIVYSRGGSGNTAIGGLADGTTYYVIVPANDAT